MASSVCCTVGTTLEMATPVMRCCSMPRVPSSVWMKTPYSSAVCSRRVVRRHDATRRGPLNTPTFVLVLPTSMTSSIGGLHSHVARPGAAAYALGALEPCLAEALHARREKACVPAIEGGQHHLPHLGEIVGASCLHPQRGGERRQRLRKSGLVDVQ